MRIHTFPALLLVVALGLAASAHSSGAETPTRAGTQRATVASVTDGDTIRVEVGGREEPVRILAIDTPEVYPDAECGGPQATRSLERMLDPGDRVRLVRDATQGNRDIYDRLLRYVHFRGADVGLAQIRRGWASVYVFDPPAKRVPKYRKAAKRAKRQNKGAWKRCGGF
jgi:micrococcal nuclease